MSNRRDHQAEFGYTPNWDLQRAKQDSVAEEFYGEVEELSPEEVENMDEE